jgi:hypothetical protein
MKHKNPATGSKNAHHRRARWQLPRYVTNVHCFLRCTWNGYIMYTADAHRDQVLYTFMEVTSHEAHQLMSCYVLCRLAILENIICTCHSSHIAKLKWSVNYRKLTAKPTGECDGASARGFGLSESSRSFVRHEDHPKCSYLLCKNEAFKYNTLYHNVSAWLTFNPPKGAQSQSQPGTKVGGFSHTLQANSSRCPRPFTFL